MLPPFGNSDHSQIAFSVFIDNAPDIRPDNCHHSEAYYDWNSADYESIIDDLLCTNWYELLTTNLTVDSLWNAFHCILTSIIDKHVSKKTVASNLHAKRYKPHYPSGIKRAIARKLCLWHKRKENPSNCVIASAYRTATARCRHLIKQFELKKEQKVIDSKNTGTFFRFVNKRLSCKRGIGALRNKQNATIASDTERANLLNEYFCSTCTEDNGVMPPIQRAVGDSTCIDSICFTEDKVLRAIKKLKPSRSSGPDGFSSLLFKKLSPALTEPLSLLYSSFMSVGQVPSSWTHAIVTPIYKGGSASELSNYRPISLTSVACKIMERIIVTDLLDYLRVNNIISNHQHGFLSGKSTCTNLLETLNDWTLAIKNRRSITVAYIDYQKAFDAVSHSKLLAKLSAYGIEGNIRDWISNFLSSRTQQTKVGSALSDVGNLSSGVVQGSVIGPLLFLLYINDVVPLLTDDRCTCKLYADDLKLYTSLQLNEDTSILQRKLDELCTWSDLWQLRISYKKCAVMSVHNSNTVDTHMHLGSYVLPSVTEINDLGVLIDNKLSFRSHINRVVAQASIRANLIKKCFVSKDISTLIRAYKVYVRPLLEYATCVWSPSYFNAIQQIECVQRKFTKGLPGFRHLPYPGRLLKSKLESLEIRRLHYDLVMTYKILSGLVVVDANDFFSYANSGYNTRGHCLKLLGQQCRVNTRKFFFSERVIESWNSLPATILDFSSLSKFKMFLKKVDFSKFLLDM
jgi:hypothetical protein